jgi:hypothetical protein
MDYHPLIKKERLLNNSSLNDFANLTATYLKKTIRSDFLQFPVKQHRMAEKDVRFLPSVDYLP